MAQRGVGKARGGGGVERHVGDEVGKPGTTSWCAPVRPLGRGVTFLWATLVFQSSSAPPHGSFPLPLALRSVELVVSK